MFLMTQDGGSSPQLWHSISALYRQYHFKVAKEEERPLLSHRRVSDLLAELENSGLAVSRTSWQSRHGYGRQYRLTVPPEFFADCFDP
jgi:archaeal cell division control protein 6